MKRQSGFTLIELVMVIVILGVLAVAALPKFIDLKSDAQASALAGVASSLSSASSINYAARSANSGKGSAVSDCQNVGTLLQGGLPAGYAIPASAVSAGAAVTCTVTQSATSTNASFVAYGI